MKIILNKLTYIIIYMCACAMAVAQSGINIKKNYPRFDRVRYEYQATTDSVKNGKFVEYHLNKNTKWTGHYTMGKKDSVFTEYFEDGKTIKTLQDHTKGIEKQYYNAKKLAHEVTLVNEKYNGAFKGYYMDGSLESTGLYADGNKTGEWLFYHKNKQLDMKGNFVNGAQQGLWRYYFATGELMTTGNYIEGKRDSTWIVYYKNKQIERQGNYANDLRTGIWTTYFEDGKKLQQGAYYKDKADDKWYAWYNDGIVKDEGEYKNGLSEGVWKGNYPNGKPNYVGNKHNDLKEGVWKYYDQKAGILIKEQEYKLGAPDGYFKTYYALTGKPEQEGYYQKGLKENTWKYYYPFGMLLMYENHKAGKMHGEKVTYFENGKKNSVTGYVNNLQHGKWTYYNDKEEKLYSVTYEFGKKVKETKYNNGNPEEIKYTKDKPKKKKT